MLRAFTIYITDVIYKYINIFIFIYLYLFPIQTDKRFRFRTNTIRQKALASKIVPITIRTIYFMFCLRNKEWTDPDLMHIIHAPFFVFYPK